ncbi:hypothetical protein SAMN05421640_1285 [Ekhidna lutea]|uniref:Uncharacterized protein n=1 Tax=Ekhidna lutea TaxID=447679 RepID=A0A239HF81_EKHLU|nr:hypothetical protein [Ekhidna lutea]SNS80066.1 hypothetical protein SAMN05421640_1285 [Ekhidna lutea]
MPYIKQEDRPKLDQLVEQMKEAGIAANGDLNYLLYAFCKRHVSPSYNNYKNFIGELNQCATEIERRILAPYEDEKMRENGDV